MIGKISTRPAWQIRAGHVTLDGVVLSVNRDGETISIEHRNVQYVHTAEEPVQIIGSVPRDVLEAVLEAIGRERQPADTTPPARWQVVEERGLIHVGLVATDGTVLEYLRGPSGPTRFGNAVRAREAARAQNAK